MKSEEPREEKARRSAPDELSDIRGNIDKDLVPDRHAWVAGEIKERTGSGRESGKRPWAESLPSKIGFVRKAYFVLSVLALIDLAGGFLSWDFPDEREMRTFIEGILPGIFLILIYFGLRYKCQWVVPAILFFSASKIGILLIQFGKLAEGLFSYFLTAGWDAAMIFFFLYQIRLFTNPTVTSSFGSRGTIIF